MDITGGLNIVHGDYNNDGLADLFILRGGWFGEDGQHPNSLLKNNGDDSFTDVTIAANIYSERPTQTASWGDFNNDGWIDIFVGNESAEGTYYPSELFRNNGDGTFTEIAQSVGLNIIGFVKGAVWGDINNDGLLDLYVSRLGEPNLLFENSGPKKIGYLKKLHHRPVLQSHSIVSQFGFGIITMMVGRIFGFLDMKLHLAMWLWTILA